MSIVTSLMLGKPVICTDWVGVKDYITDGANGMLVKMADAYDLQRKMVRLFHDSEMYARLSVGAQVWSGKNADLSFLQQEIDKLVTQLIASK
jgi:glycosyltransferase involved in cell wall biosynthesis